MAILKLVLVKVTEYTCIRNRIKLLAYGVKCVNEGSESDLYCDPNIPTSYYDDGTFANDALDAANKKYKKAPIKNNLNIVEDKMALLIIWLNGYSAKVVKIANDPLNCTTREEAATNIGLAGLIPQKLKRSKKGTPDQVEFTAKYSGEGIIDIDITNGKSFKPSSMLVIAIGVPPVTNPATPLPSVKVIDGQVFVKSKVGVPVVVKPIIGKGKSAKLTGMNTHPAFNIYIYCQNAKDEISSLSAPVLVSLILPTE